MLNGHCSMLHGQYSNVQMFSVQCSMFNVQRVLSTGMIIIWHLDRFWRILWIF